ncbi:MAG: hypothetical protein ABIL06_25900 [Pseudomonadota bacterium]
MEDYKKAGILENEFEAQLVASVLAERGIPHLLRSYHDTAFDGLFQTQKGWGHVSSPEEYHQEIKEILEDLTQGDAGELVEAP